MDEVTRQQLLRVVVVFHAHKHLHSWKSFGLSFSQFKCNVCHLPFPMSFVVRFLIAVVLHIFTQWEACVPLPNTIYVNVETFCHREHKNWCLIVSSRSASPKADLCSNQKHLAKHWSFYPGTFAAATHILYVDIRYKRIWSKKNMKYWEIENKFTNKIIRVQVLVYIFYFCISYYKIQNNANFRFYFHKFTHECQMQCRIGRCIFVFEFKKKSWKKNSFRKTSLEESSHIRFQADAFQVHKKYGNLLGRFMSATFESVQS